MDIASLNLIYYSPTGTTRKIAKKITECFPIRAKENNLTPFRKESEKIVISRESFTIIGMPVYSGRLPFEAIERLKNLQGNNSMAVIVIVYGNRAYEDALLELKHIVEESEFRIIAAGTFIGEHSFSTSDKPLAINRPDTSDLLKAEEFGKLIINKLNNLEYSNYSDNLNIPGNFPYKELAQLPSLTPFSDMEKCDKCEQCVEVCPVNAITIHEDIKTKMEDCTWCCACVKNCPVNARQFQNPVIKTVTDRLIESCKERKEPEFFL